MIFSYPISKAGGRSLLFLTLFVSLGFWSCQTTRPVGAEAAEEPIEFIILQLNDVYEIAPVEGGKYGGLARVATLKKELMRENPNTIVVLSGDFLSPSFVGTLKMDGIGRIAGLQMVEALNAMGMDYVTFGNHEFDFSDVELLKKRIDQSDFTYICSNVQLVEDGVYKSFSQKGQPVPSYLIREIKNRRGDVMKLGLTGVVLPFSKQEYLNYLPVEETFRKVYAEMEPQVDLSVALTHLNVEDDIALARAVPGIKLFLGGHEHVNMSHYIERTIITKADANAKTVYVHRGKYFPCSGQADIRSTLVTIDDRMTEDPTTREVVDKWVNAVDKVAIDMGYDPERKLMVADQVLECSEAVVRSRPTNYGRLTARAFEAVWPGADVYLLNSGSMRLDDNLHGTVTEYDVLRTFPFGGPIVKMKMKGTFLNRLLKTGIFDNRGKGGYLQTLYIDPAGQDFTVREEPLEPEKEYSVVLPQFVAEGKEGGLGFLEDHAFETKDGLTTAEGKEISNDIRNIVIYFMEKIGRF